MKRTPRPPPSIAAMLQRLRKSHGMSLDQLAARSGVSKSMLSEIERNQTNPTIATVWRLAEALEVSIEDLLRSGQSSRRGIERMQRHALPTITSADGRCVLKILSPIEMAGHIEWYELSIEPGAALVSDAHDKGTMEHLLVLEGRMMVESEDESAEATAGETLRYPADCKHAIRNTRQRRARAILVMTMKRA